MTGAASIPSPVTNLSATYASESNTVSVSWVDGTNTLETDGSFTYQVSYNITVAGILLLNESAVVTPTNASVTTFLYTISEGDFLQEGVSVDVAVSANSMTEMSSLTSVSVKVTGSEDNYLYLGL